VRCSRTLSIYSIIWKTSPPSGAGVIGPPVEEVVEIDLALDGADLRRIAEIERVERAAPQRRFDELEVDRLIGDRHAEEFMRHRDRRQRREGMIVDLLVVENGRGAAARPVARQRHLAQLGDAVAVIIDAQIALGDPDLAHRRVERAGLAPWHLVLVLEAFEPLQPVIGGIVAAELAHRRLLVAHLDQLGDRPLDAVGDERRLVEADGAAVDQELVRRQRLHPHAPVADRAPDDDVVQHRGAPKSA
jgi:hypothetical protein